MAQDFELLAVEERRQVLQLGTAIQMKLLQVVTRYSARFFSLVTFTRNPATKATIITSAAACANSFLCRRTSNAICCQL